MISIIRAIGHQYDRCFRQSPLLTLAVANGFCSALGDSAAQLISIWSAQPDRTVEINYVRLLKYLLYGLNMGPVSGKWNELLERRFPQPHKSTDLTSSSEKPISPIELMEINSTVSTDSPDSKSHPGISLTPRKNKGPSSNLINNFKMVLTDQLIMAPLSLLYFICFMGLADGHSWEVIYARINRLFLKLLFANWQVWPIIQLINFTFMPLKLRVPFGAVCGIIWTVFLSYAST